MSPFRWPTLPPRPKEPEEPETKKPLFNGPIVSLPPEPPTAVNKPSLFGPIISLPPTIAPVPVPVAVSHPSAGKLDPDPEDKIPIRISEKDVLTKGTYKVRFGIDDGTLDDARFQALRSTLLNQIPGAVDVTRETDGVTVHVRIP